MGSLSPEILADKVQEYFCKPPAHGEKIHLSIKQIEKYFQQFSFYRSYYKGNNKERFLNAIRSKKYIIFHE